MSREASGNIGTVLDHIQKLPSLPSLVLEILDSFNNEQVDIRTLARKISLDQALVARVMRVANSAFFGLSGQIGTIPEAIALLGFNNLRGLVTAAAIINTFPKAGGHFVQLQFWRHSICTAVCAKVLAKHAGLNAETAFTAGVLHDIGRLIMVIHYPQVIAQLDLEGTSSVESLQAERAALGVDHAVLGGELAKRWNFPVTIREAIALHHTPPGFGDREGLTDVVYVANLFAHALDRGALREEKAVQLAAEACARLRLEPGALSALAEEAQRLYDNSVLLLGE